MERIERAPLVAALKRAKLCVGDAKGPVEAYKCFRFKQGMVSTFDSRQGIFAVCDFPFDCLVQAERFYDYLTSHPDEWLDASYDGSVLKVGGASFSTPDDQDFPEIIPEDIVEYPLTGSLLAESLGYVRFCVDKNVVKQNVPAAVLLVGRDLYAADTTRACRVRWVEGLTLVPEDLRLLIPIDAVDAMIELGEPTALVASGSAVGAYYDKENLYYIARQLTGPPFHKPIDEKIESLEKDQTFYDVPGTEFLKTLTRLNNMVANDDLRLSYENSTLTLAVEDKAAGTKASEQVLWAGPEESFKLKISIKKLIAALKEKPSQVDVGDVLYGGKSVLRFVDGEGYDHLVALIA